MQGKNEHSQNKELLSNLGELVAGIKSELDVITKLELEGLRDRKANGKFIGENRKLLENMNRSAADMKSNIDKNFLDDIVELVRDIESDARNVEDKIMEINKELLKNINRLTSDINLIINKELLNDLDRLAKAIKSKLEDSKDKENVGESIDVCIHEHKPFSILSKLKYSYNVTTALNSKGQPTKVVISKIKIDEEKFSERIGLSESTDKEQGKEFAHEVTRSFRGILTTYYER